MKTSAIPLAVYVHFPWCVKKCPYCDFNSHPQKGELDETGYVDALISDWQQQTRTADSNGRHLRPLSVFLGGGTPSLFSGAAMGRVLQAIFADTANTTPDCVYSPEVTMEANPGTTEHASFAAYRNAGINRLSLGGQSFDAAQLQRLGRIHSAQDTATAFRQARRSGFVNINIDLMYALPHQTIAGALDDLQQAIDLGAEHISWYQLTLEPKTEFARRPPPLPDDNLVADMEAAGRTLLGANGYQRYEISAYAQPGRECRHNLNYWRFGDYLGIGAGAHGKLTSGTVISRSAHPNPPRLYLHGNAPDWTVVPQDNIVGEFMLNALRLRAGVSRELFCERTGINWAAIAPLWQQLAERGLVATDRVQASERGYELLDMVVAEFLD